MSYCSTKWLPSHRMDDVARWHQVWQKWACMKKLREPTGFRTLLKPHCYRRIDRILCSAVIQKVRRYFYYWPTRICLYRNHVQHCAKGNRVNQLSSKNLAQLREPSFLWHWVLACFTLASNLKFQKRTSISQGSAGRQKSERLAWMINDSSSHRVKLCHWIGILITSIMSNSWQTV